MRKGLKLALSAVLSGAVLATSLPAEVLAGPMSATAPDKLALSGQTDQVWYRRGWGGYGGGWGYRRGYYGGGYGYRRGNPGAAIAAGVGLGLLGAGLAASSGGYGYGYGYPYGGGYYAYPSYGYGYPYGGYYGGW